MRGLLDRPGLQSVAQALGTDPARGGRCLGRVPQNHPELREQQEAAQGPYPAGVRCDYAEADARGIGGEGPQPPVTCCYYLFGKGNSEQ